MKIWRFYKLPEDKNAKQSYDLYAITNRKEFAKAFMETRDMNKFYLRCTKEDRETYTEYANKNLDHILDYRALVTKDKLKNGFYGKKSITVLCTNFEYQIATNEDSVPGCFLDEMYWTYEAPKPTIFNEKIIEALNTLEYNRTFKIYNSVKLSPEEDDYSAPDYWIDEFMVFITTFKDIFKI